MLIVGERINATNKRIAQAIQEKDANFICNEAIAQVEAGADYIITKPIFDIEGFNIWWDQIKKLEIEKKINIIAGIKLLTNKEKAEAYAVTRPSPMIPSKLLEDLASNKDKESIQDKGIEIATQTIEYLSSLDGIKGFYITGDEDHDSVIKVMSVINKVK